MWTVVRSAFFYPQDVRYDYLAIRAFNVELSNIADSIRNQHLGRLRFQWWREAIASLNTVSAAIDVSTGAKTGFFFPRERERH